MGQSPAHSAEIKVFLTGAARGAWDILRPQFERASGHKAVTVSALPLELVAKVEAGEPFDVIVLSLDVEGLIKKGKIDASSRIVLGQIGVGVAVRAGSPKPDFSTVEKFK
jgi:molybdate transport system substrate-binding protein